MGRPRVSVLLPVYNGERFLRETLDSAFAQTMPDLEVIAVDDGSSDGSVALLEAYEDPRLRVLRQSNLGAPTALNTALDAARGEYIGFLDQDDLWNEQKLERHLEVMDENPKLDLTFSRYELIDEACGRVAHRLAERGWLDDTDIFFTTDHGELQGDFGLPFKGPYHTAALMRVPRTRRPSGELPPFESGSHVQRSSTTSPSSSLITSLQVTRQP